MDKILYHIWFSFLGKHITRLVTKVIPIPVEDLYFCIFNKQRCRGDACLIVEFLRLLKTAQYFQGVNSTALCSAKN